MEASIVRKTEAEYQGKFFKRKARILPDSKKRRHPLPNDERAKVASLVSSSARVKNGGRRIRLQLEEDFSVHILSVSAAMVGVCLTVIGLIRIVITLGKFDTIADNLLAVAALIFLISCFCSYWALRTRGVRRMHRLERIADAAFLVGPAAHGGRVRRYHFCHDLIGRCRGILSGREIEAAWNRC